MIFDCHISPTVKVTTNQRGTSNVTKECEVANFHGQTSVAYAYV